MIALTLAEIAQITGGEVHGPTDLVVDAEAYLDSRAAVPGGLFVAIAGERVDGHAYAAGAHAVLGSRPTVAPTVVVADPTVALGRLARHVVDQLPATRLALTGSQGKTSTKDLLAQVLATDGATVATAANHNNELGVPITALRATENTRHVLLEMGARGIGHLAYLCEIAPPQIAAVLNVGTAHVGEFGSREAIAQAKGELLEALPADGVAVLNAADPLVAAMRARTQARVLTFNADATAADSLGGADVVARAVRLDDLARPSFDLSVSGSTGPWAPVQLQVTGHHQVANALAAAAMAHAAGVGVEAVAAGLSAAGRLSRSRMEVTERADGVLVVNDAYNANPDSTEAALDTAAELGRRRPGRTIAVLGTMLELGDTHTEGHRRVGAHAARLGYDVVVVVGEAAAPIADTARQGAGEVVLTASREDALAWVRENAGAGDVVLIKASLGAALEWVAHELLSD